MAIPTQNGVMRRNASNTQLGAILARDETRFTYTFDFGDEWRHSVVVEEVVVTDPKVNHQRFVVVAHQKMLAASWVLRSSSVSWPILPMKGMRPP